MPNYWSYWHFVDEAEARESFEEDDEPAYQIQYRAPEMFEGDDIPF